MTGIRFPLANRRETSTRTSLRITEPDRPADGGGFVAAVLNPIAAASAALERRRRSDAVAREDRELRDEAYLDVRRYWIEREKDRAKEAIETQYIADSAEGEAVIRATLAEQRTVRLEEWSRRDAHVVSLKGEMVRDLETEVAAGRIDPKDASERMMRIQAMSDMTTDMLMDTAERFSRRDAQRVESLLTGNRTGRDQDR